MRNSEFFTDISTPKTSSSFGSGSYCIGKNLNQLGVIQAYSPLPQEVTPHFPRLNPNQDCEMLHKLPKKRRPAGNEGSKSKAAIEEMKGAFVTQA